MDQPDKHPTTLTLMPFAGLGFDLRPVAAAASLLALRRVAGVVRPFMVRPRASIHRPHGYGLMVRLCRETGGS